MVPRSDAVQPSPVRSNERVENLPSRRGCRSHQAASPWGWWWVIALCYPSPPLHPLRHRPLPGHPTPSHSPGSPGDFRTAEKGKFLCYAPRWEAREYPGMAVQPEGFGLDRVENSPPLAVSLAGSNGLNLPPGNPSP